ncbi:MAG: nicotinate (nicotinamide) nucleotide adenylyltransferase [Candidatus Hydrogenedens sp.]|nr:nicotinate (nicotinamide) nucleotide adenylyltransferase [Candidatus Hydrogenedens sp.]
MSNPPRIGVLGGTFDPIHNAHLELARAAQAQARLDKVLFVVAAQPPHKRGGVTAPAEDRLRLVQVALLGEPGMEACPLELERPGPSYTADTLRELSKRHPGAEFFLILGLDALADLPGWREPETILQHARVLVASRPDQGDAIDPSLEGHYDFLEFPPNDMSSTEVRARLQQGDPVADLLPAPVIEAIRETGLYGAARA